MRLEDLAKGIAVKGIIPHQTVTVVEVSWFGTDAVELIYKESSGSLGSVLLYRDREATLEVLTDNRPWSLDGDGELLRLVSEAHRIRLAHLFDPMSAVRAALVEPLPHQITAVYGEMLPRQPLRFLLADDPGAGKTIMAGLLISELSIRGDLNRCLIVCPGSLATQWQEELDRRFHLPFEILTNDRVEAARTGNIFNEMDLTIARLDKLSRDDELQRQLQETEWDLIVCDEAHKMSASFYGGEVQATKRYKLGKLLASVTRHFLLMTATPHNGKEEDFQLFMALLDGDRFEGKFRDGVHVVDTSDMMRRLVKEDLLKFDGTLLFPERRAYTVNYRLSSSEADLYERVTNYVRQEFNRADHLSKGRKGTVGFALTILQRRLASSPEAIYQSLRRRRERLRKRLKEEQWQNGTQTILRFPQDRVPHQSEVGDSWEEPGAEVLEDWEDELDPIEREIAEEELLDRATAARTIAELEAEIQQLESLEKLALQVRRSGTDKKWEELSSLLQEREELFDASGCRRKLVIFTEHKDTLNYLTQKIRNLLGRDEAVVTISGGMGRDERKKAQEAFTQDPDVFILIATDAAGEGINLQRSHLMVNFDLPWNGNRIEQRFGRIHRIGQTEVCHLWNLVAEETREGQVYGTLLRKLEAEQKALGGKVFDVLGQAIDGARLRELLIEAIRDGDRPEVRSKLTKEVSDFLDRERLQQLISDKALVRDTLDLSKVRQIKEEMERAEARKLQPHFIASFFIAAFTRLGGTIRERESRRYEITYVPASLRNGRVKGRKEPIVSRYERICFDKELISIPGKPQAAFICPGHPLLDATLNSIWEQHQSLLKRGSILVDEGDSSENLRFLVYLEHAIRDARTDNSGKHRIASRRMQYVEIEQMADSPPQIGSAGYAPYLDYRPLVASEKEAIAPLLSPLNVQEDLEKTAIAHAVSQMVPQHLQELKQHREELIDKTLLAVKDRLTKEINYWDCRSAELKEQELLGKPNAKINSAKARARADELQARLTNRLQELEQERLLSPLPPVVIGGALIVPKGLLQKLMGSEEAGGTFSVGDRKRIERLAMDAVIEAEKRLGCEPRDVSLEKLGYDIESRVQETGKLRFIEVKGRIAGADAVTVTKNEIITALNKPNDFILALVEVAPSPPSPLPVEKGCPATLTLRYVRQPFGKEPDFGATSVNYSFPQLWNKGIDPLKISLT